MFKMRFWPITAKPINAMSPLGSMCVQVRCCTQNQRRHDTKAGGLRQNNFRRNGWGRLEWMGRPNSSASYLRSGPDCSLLIAHCSLLTVHLWGMKRVETDEMSNEQ